VTTGPDNGAIYLGSYKGYLKFFTGFIFNFEYYITESSNISILCGGLCNVCPTVP
jgi:hypothetical protein